MIRERLAEVPVGGHSRHKQSNVMCETATGKTKHLTSDMEKSSKNTPCYIKFSKNLGKGVIAQVLFLPRLYLEWCTALKKHNHSALAACKPWKWNIFSFQSHLCKEPGSVNPWGDSKFNDQTVVEIRLKYHWQISLAERNFRKETGSGRSLLFLICSENAVSQWKANRRENNTMHYKMWIWV